MQIHELNTFSGTVGDNDYFVTDNGTDTSKINASAIVTPFKDYVTPEMFGAVGDGSTDDSTAIQNAIDNANGLPVYFSNKVYLTSETIILNNFNVVNDGTIKYIGNGYALKLSPSSNISGAYLRLGNILAENGSGLIIDTTNAWIQYVTIDFIQFYVGDLGDCIHAKVVGNNWINEIRLLNGRFARCANGVYIDHSERTGSGYTAHWTFDRVGFEGCTHGVNVPSKVARLSFTNCRAEESITDVVYTNASTATVEQSITWVGSPVNGAYWQNCKNYYVTCLSGFIDYRGTYITPSPILYFNGMLYGLSYTNGKVHNVSDYGAYSYDSDSTTQEVDFAKVYDFSSAGVPLYERAVTRYFPMPNNTSATTTNIYLDQRMFVDWAYPENTYLLEMTLSPHVVLNIYNKKGGTLLYTQTGGNSTTYPKFAISAQRGFYIVESVNLSRKSA